MVIRTNIMALNAHRNMMMHQNAVAKSLARLSSGYRINSAADDAAGLGISEKMRGQIRGLKMASQNAQHAVSMLQTAEGGLNEVHAMLQRMKELAVQAANGTYDDHDRAQIAKEYDALKDEINRISGYTNYNGIKLLDGSLGGQKARKGMEALGLSQDAITVSGVVNGTGRLDFRQREGGGFYASLQVDEKVYFAEIADGDTSATFDLGDGNRVSVALDTAKLKPGVLTEIKFKDDTANVKNAIGANLNTQVIFQIGANGTADQRLGMHIDNIASYNLGDVAEGNNLANSSILTRDDANGAIDVLDSAIKQVALERAGIGAQINRLGYTINNLENTAENLQDAESRIRDADMAEEMMKYIKHNVLLQAAQMVMAHAMQQPYQILSLLRSM